MLGEAVIVVVKRRRAGVDDELVRPQRVQKRLDDVERQAEVVGHRAALVGAEDGQVLADRLLDELLAQSGLFQRGRLGGNEVLVGQQGCQEGFIDVERRG